METDVRMEKFLDVMVERMRDELGQKAENCPVVAWLEDVLAEVRTSNNASLMREVGLPPLRILRQGKCVLERK